ncbi:hypothetical protein KC921_05455, partial [Candidatus Woesebacteria bacterium]|nr:hypothetical protein [Candidatus Woesebacteria bacterium]
SFLIQVFLENLLLLLPPGLEAVVVAVVVELPQPHYSALPRERLSGLQLTLVLVAEWWEEQGQPTVVEILFVVRVTEEVFQDFEVPNHRELLAPIQLEHFVHHPILILQRGLLQTELEAPSVLVLEVELVLEAVSRPYICLFFYFSLDSFLIP